MHHGFIVMVSPAHPGVNGHGKAPHYGLTEAWYLGKAPTRDFLAWDDSPFTEKRKRDAYRENALGPSPPRPCHRRGTHTGVFLLRLYWLVCSYLSSVCLFPPCALPPSKTHGPRGEHALARACIRAQPGRCPVFPRKSRNKGAIKLLKS
jgi:hypothetical protein